MSNINRKPKQKLLSEDDRINEVKSLKGFLKLITEDWYTSVDSDVTKSPVFGNITPIVDFMNCQWNDEFHLISWDTKSRNINNHRYLVRQLSYDGPFPNCKLGNQKTYIVNFIIWNNSDVKLYFRLSDEEFELRFPKYG